jgi:hypothetical protein
MPDKDEVPGSSPGRPTTVLPAQSAAASRPVASTACLGRVGAARPPRSRAQGPSGAGHQRPRHGRPRAGDHVPDDLRAAMPQVGEPRRVPGSLPTSGPCATGSSWSARRSSLAAGRGPPYDHGQADASVGPARLRQLRASGSDSGRRQPVVDTVRATTPTPAVRAVWLLAASARLTNSPDSDTADAGTPDSGRRMPRCPHAQPDTGRRTPDAHTGQRTPGRLDAHTGHWTPVAWTSQAWTLDAHTGHWTPDAAEDRTG